MNIYKDFSVSEITNFKIGGKAQYVFECQNKEDILSALDFIEKNHIKKFFILGLGTNLLFPESYYEGAIIRILNSGQRSIATTSDDMVVAFAGESVDRLIQFGFENNLIGLEWAGGLPGTVGGGVRGNAGAFGGEIKDTFYKAEIIRLYNSSFDIETLSHNDMSFSYRNSFVKQNKNTIIISSMFILSKTDSTQIEKAKQIYQQNIAYRLRNHPIEYPNAGSIFKNIVKKEEVEKILSVYPDIQENVEGKWHGKVAMGYLIKRLGFENYTIGGASVSQKHGNYIINTGRASYQDVKLIIAEIQAKFQELFAFIPEVEIEIVSTDDKR